MQTLSAESQDLSLERRWGAARTPPWTGATILEARVALAAKTRKPLPHGAVTDAERLRGRHRGPSVVQHPLHEADSPRESQARILVAVHSVLWWL